MLEKIYLILTGENEKKRPRSKKLIKVLNKEKSDNYKIVITGKSGFDFNRKPTEAEKLRDFLISKNPKLIDKIILENEAMDTLGNMIFSYPIICNILKENSSNKKIKLILITEKFHMKRSKMLLINIFKDLFISNRNLELETVSADSLGIKSFWLKNKILRFLNNFIQFRFDEKSLMYLYKREKQLLLTDAKDYLIKEALFLDLKIHYKNKIHKFEDYRNFLFSLPVYNKYYKPTKKIDLNLSIYNQLIKSFILNKK